MTGAVEWIVVGMGSNLGDARAHLKTALLGLQGIERRLGLQRWAVSPLYQSPPWQAQGPDFLNAVVVLQGHGDAQAPWALLHALQALEAECGRERPFRYAPRTLDLDLILYGHRLLDTPELQLPHPRALQRAFVLQPLWDVKPGLDWPGLGAGWVKQLQALGEPAPQRLEDPSWPSS